MNYELLFNYALRITNCHLSGGKKMKKIFLSLALLFVICSVAIAAPRLSEFPLGMTQKDAIAKGLIMRDQHGGILATMFGGKEWPTALEFENDKLVYLILKGVGEEFISVADEGLWQIGWLVIYMATDKNLVFDAVKLAASGKNEMAIADEYEKFQEIMQSQKFTNSVSMYVSDRVWETFKQLRDESPIEKYADTALCNVTIQGNDVSLVFTTFGYMDKINKQAASNNTKNTSGNKETQTPKTDNK
jgi:hypothetical protein